MKRNKTQILVALLGVLLVAQPNVVDASIQINLFGTGLSISGTPLSGGAGDPHYTILESGKPAVVLSDLWGNWFPNDAGSAWIGWSDNAFPGNYGTHTFRITFDLSGYDPAKASLSGGWCVDNSGYIQLNGVSTGVYQSDDFGVAPSFNSFVLTSGFNSGLNTLDFVCDFPDGFDGLRVGNLVVEVVPEPSVNALLLVAAPTLVGLHRYNERRARLKNASCKMRAA